MKFSIKNKFVKIIIIFLVIVIVFFLIQFVPYIIGFNVHSGYNSNSENIENSIDLGIFISEYKITKSSKDKLPKNLKIKNIWIEKCWRNTSWKFKADTNNLTGCFDLLIETNSKLYETGMKEWTIINNLNNGLGVGLNSNLNLIRVSYNNDKIMDTIRLDIAKGENKHFDPDYEKIGEIELIRVKTKK